MTSNLRRNEMHIQIVNFNLDGLDAADYEKHCEQVAPAFAAMPGLMAKFCYSSSAPKANW